MWKPTSQATRLTLIVLLHLMFSNGATKTRKIPLEYPCPHAIECPHSLMGMFTQTAPLESRHLLDKVFYGRNPILCSRLRVWGQEQGHRLLRPGPERV